MIQKSCKSNFEIERGVFIEASKNFFAAMFSYDGHYDDYYDGDYDGHYDGNYDDYYDGNYGGNCEN